MPNIPRLRVIYMGTPAIACAPLARLISMPETEVICVVSQPDKPKGRDLKLQASPVKDLALNHNIPILQPEKAKDPEFIEKVRALKPDVGVVMAYGQILPQTLLDVPPHGCLNLHTSLLPKYRGAAPIQYALLNGDTETGVTLMKMDAGMDTGSIISFESIPISNEDTAASLHDQLANTAALLLEKCLIPYIGGGLKPTPQPEGATYAPRIKKDEGLIDWNEPAIQILNRLRAFTPWPGIYTQLNGKILKIHRAQVTQQNGEPGHILSSATDLVVGTGQDSLLINELQLEGGKRLPAQQFLAGHKLQPGSRLG